MTSVKRKSTKASWSSNRELPKSFAPAEKVERKNGIGEELDEEVEEPREGSRGRPSKLTVWPAWR